MEVSVGYQRKKMPYAYTSARKPFYKPHTRQYDLLYPSTLAGYPQKKAGEMTEAGEHVIQNNCPYKVDGEV